MTNLSIFSLKDRPQFRQDALTLIEESFNYEKDQSYAIDFYSLTNKDNDEHRYLLIENDKLIGHIGVKKKYFEYQNFSTPFIFIGGIAVKQSERGKGYLKILINHVFKKYKEECSLYMLWSENPSLYERYNFHLSVGQIQIENSIQENDWKKTKLAQCTHDEKRQIQELYSNKIATQFICPLRTEESWKELEKIISTDLYIKRSKDKIVAYAFVGKGKDMKDICHEISFEEDKQLRDYVNSPSFKTWLPENYAQYNSKAQYQYGAIVKIANNKLFKDFIEFFSDAEISINMIDDEKVSFSFHEEEFDLNHADFLTSLFGPYPFKEFQHFQKAIFIPGLDSI